MLKKNLPECITKQPFALLDTDGEEYQAVSQHTHCD